MDRHVFALALVRAGAPMSMYHPLTHDELMIQDYLKMTPYKDAPLLRVDFVEVARLRHEVLVQESVRQLIPRGFMFNMSSFSYDRLVTAFLDQGEGDLGVALQGWAAVHNLSLDDLLDSNGRVLLTIKMPTPHGILVQRQQWSSWALPLIAERRVAAGLGYSLIKPLLSEVDVAGLCRDARETCQEMGDSDIGDLLSENGLYVLLNTLRRAYADHPSEQLAQQIRWFQRRRDMVLEGRLQSTRKAYAMELIVNSLLLAGFLRNVGHYADALRFATVAAIQDPALQKHVLSGLFKVKASPSPSTLRRHQLTIHMGHCLLEQELTARFLEKGCVRYSQVDSSPQGFMDWVMHGSRTMLNEQLVDTKKGSRLPG